MHERLGLNVHRDAWPTPTVHVVYHGLNVVEAGGAAAARIRERALLEERSLVTLLLH